MKLIKYLLPVALLVMMSMSVSAYTWVNRTVSVGNVNSNRTYTAVLWAYTTSSKWCSNADGFNPYEARNITFFSLEENMTIREREFCHPDPTLSNVLVEFACPYAIQVNGVSGARFPRYPGLFLFNCKSLGQEWRCKHNRCVKPQ